MDSSSRSCRVDSRPSRAAEKERPREPGHAERYVATAHPSCHKYVALPDAAAVLDDRTGLPSAHSVMQQGPAMKSASTWVAIVASGAIPWLVACSSDDSGSSCPDAAPVALTGDASTDATQASDAPIDAPADHTLSIDSGAADVVSVDQSSVEAAPAVADGSSVPDSSADGLAVLMATSEAGAIIPDASAKAEAAPPVVTGISTLAGVRVANWSPDAPAFDFCLAPHGTSAFQGPILAAQVNSEAEAGACPSTASALEFTQVSSYSFVQPMQYDVKLVAAGSGSCASGFLSSTSLPSLGVSSFETIALVGEFNKMGSDPGLQITGFLDDWTPADAGISMRFIQAAPALSALDFGLGSGAKFTPIFTSVPFDSAAKMAMAPDGGPASMDSNDYLPLPALSGASLSTRVHGSTQDSAVASGVWVDGVWVAGISASAGAVLTVVAIGPVPDAGVAASLLECVDNAGTPCTLSNCNVISYMPQ